MGALTLISTALSAAATIAATQSQAKAAEFTAEMAQQQADRERQTAARDAADHRRRNSRNLAASRARRAGSGVTAQGSPLLIDEATAAEIELGAQDILAGGAAAAYGDRQRAALSRAGARSARTGGFLRGGSTLLTGLGRGGYGSGGFRI